MYRIVLFLLLAYPIFGQVNHPDYVPNQVIIKFKNDQSGKQIKSLKSQMNAHLDKVNHLSKAEVWTVKQNQDIPSLVKQYQNHPDIEFIEPNYYYYLHDSCNEENLLIEASSHTSKIQQHEDLSPWEKFKNFFKKNFVKSEKSEIKSGPNESTITVNGIIPNDVYFSDQWGLHNSGRSIGNNPGGTSDADIDVPEAWAITTASPSIVIGVIDSGVDWTHPDLINNIWQNLGEDADGDGKVIEWDGSSWIFDPGDENGIDDDGNGYIDDFVGWNFDKNNNDPIDNHGHGTHVAGTIGAEGNNNIGVAGVTWDVQIAALKIFGEESTLASTIAEAIDYAVMMDMPLSNNSYGGGWYSSLIRQSIENAALNEHLLIAAAGNSNRNNDVVPDYPSSYPMDNIISVAATNRNDLIWTNSGNNVASNYGKTNVDIAAPGDFIVSTGPDTIYYNNSGTSMAAPHVTGACALLMEKYADKTYTEIKSALLNSSDILPDLIGKTVCEGRLNIYKALNYLDTLPPPIDCKEQDSLALVAFHESTNGDSWFSFRQWDLTKPMHTWDGVELNEFGCVEKLELQNFGVTGTLPPEIGNLSSLKNLVLFGNNMSGPLPATIGNLSNLEILNLRNFDLSNDYEAIIDSLSTLVNLKQLNLSDTDLIGSIGVGIGALSNLELLDLSLNEISGTIPEEIGDLGNLEYLDLSSNTITGDIPVTIYNLNKLANLDLEFNQLTGSIPSLVNNLINLKYLTLKNNNLSGDLPIELFGLSNLESLLLSNNNFSGTIPPEIGNLINLEVLTLFNNSSMTGTIPLEIGNLINLQQLNLSDINLSGQIPNEIGNLDNLQFLNLIGNELSGPIPSSIGNAVSLQNLYLSDNNFDGIIPAEIGNLNHLIRFYALNNSLSGCFETNLLNLVAEDVDVNITNGNSFDAPWEEFVVNGNGACDNNIVFPDCSTSDSLALVAFYNANNGANWDKVWDLNQPMETWAGIQLNAFGCVTSFIIDIESEVNFLHPDIFTLSYLKTLKIRESSLSGTIPRGISNLTNLIQLDLYNNNLEGPIPAQLGSLSRLKFLNLDDNNITGTIPTEFENLLDLETLILNRNGLSGNIPIELGNLSKLEGLYLSGNNLDGAIPAELSNLQNLKQINLELNNLSGGIPDEIGDLSNLEIFDVAHNNLSGCFSDNLSSLCRIGTSIHVDSGNNFDLLWEDFCNGVICPNLVWPGDSNNDGTVDHFDFLSWGLAYGNTGAARPNATTNWEGQQAPDWPVSIEGVNGKHQDCNGDGVVDSLDRQVIQNNYNNIHEFTYSVYEASPMIFEIEDDIIINGDPTILVYVKYSDRRDVALHGVSGVVDLRGWRINDVTIDVTDSSLEPDDVFQSYNARNNQLEFSLNRTDKTNITLNGPIARIIIDHANANASNARYNNISVQNGMAIQANGNTVDIIGSSLYQSYDVLSTNESQLLLGASVSHEQCTILGTVSMNVQGGTPPYTYDWNTGAVTEELIYLTANIYDVTVTDAEGLTETLSVEVEKQYILLPDDSGNYPECINPICPTLITQEGNVEAGTYHANTAINSIGSINSNVYYKAGEMVQLREGFEVQMNTEFSAEIEDCEN